MLETYLRSQGENFSAAYRTAASNNKVETQKTLSTLSGEFSVFNKVQTPSRVGEKLYPVFQEIVDADGNKKLKKDKDGPKQFFRMLLAAASVLSTLTRETSKGKIVTFSSGDKTFPMSSKTVDNLFDGLKTLIKQADSLYRNKGKRANSKQSIVAVGPSGNFFGVESGLHTRNYVIGKVAQFLIDNNIQTVAIPYNGKPRKDGSKPTNSWFLDDKGILQNIFSQIRMTYSETGTHFEYDSDDGLKQKGGANPPLFQTFLEANEKRSRLLSTGQRIYSFVIATATTSYISLGKSRDPNVAEFVKKDVDNMSAALEQEYDAFRGDTTRQVRPKKAKAPAAKTAVLSQEQRKQARNRKAQLAFSSLDTFLANSTQDD